MIKSKHSYIENICFLLCIMTFSFYLTPETKIQIYQVILYPLCFYLVSQALYNKVSFNYKSILFYYIYIFIYIYILMITLSNGNSILAGTKNWLDPLIVLTIFNILLNENFKKICYENLIYKISKLMIFLLSINTLWSILTMFLDTSLINGFFWGADLANGSKANTMGRFSGVFIQPIEAGIIYSIGLLLFWYLLTRKRKISFGQLISFLLIISGGIFSVSKVFIFCGIPLFIVLATCFLNFSKTFKISIFIILSYIILSFYLNMYWDGFDYFLRFFDNTGNNSIIDLLTAGRFNGENSQQFMLISNFTSGELIFGRGFGADITYDSLIFYLISVGGIILLIIGITYVLFLLSKAVKNLSLKNNLDVFFLAFIFLIIASNFGAPVFFLNRINLVVFLFISLFQHYIKDVKLRKEILI